MSTTSATGTAPVSIASSSSAAAAGGSVIDVSSLVSQLVAATQAPQQALITTQTQAVTTQISSLGTLKSALSTFQSSLSTLDSPTAFNTQAAVSSNPSVFSATIGASAPVGTYNVTVSQLAQAQQLLSNPFTGDGTAAIGTGTLQLSLGGTNFTVDVTSADDSLDGIAAAINAAGGNPGVTATVLQGTNGAQLLLSSTQTGAANTIQVSETDSGNALAALTYSSTAATNYTLQSKAQDASFSIAGVAATSPSNTVTSALSGVTLDLTGTTTTTGPVTLTVSTDTSTIESNISAFVSAYNTLVGTFSTLGGYDSSTGTAGPMMGNALLSGIQSQIQSALYSVVNTGSPTYNSLASIGITTNSDGTLSLNQNTLSTALSTNFSAVSSLFSGTNGVAANLNSQMTTALASSGSIATDSQTLVTQENSLTQQTSTLNTQMAALSASLTQQYSALNTLLSSLQTTSAYLTQAFASLPTVQGTPNA
ncbi:MAG TPA: flagellar filament capping protein FliD [Steroidobacteraceae bacterium]|jgi:flagellar hook-associated protein 2